jgi:hypothetical protein
MDNENAKAWWIGAIGCGAALLIVTLLGWRLYVAQHTPLTSRKISTPSEIQGESTGWRATRGARTAQEIVAAKVVQFGENRRKIAAALAARAGVEVPEDVDRFFDAVATGDWPEIDRIFTELSNLMHQEPRPKDLQACWPAVMDTLGCVAEARKWPAEKLLDYADAVLGSLRSGMIYVGGTDPGRFIPTLVNETSAGEQHIVITQNALADSLYLDYIGFLYRDRMATLTQEEQTAAFNDYITDAKRRLEHDLKFPNEPKQVAEGENLSFKDEEIGGDLIASGQISVMAVNERLLRRLMEKNPQMGFAVEESFPMKSTYPEATALGPILELRAAESGNELTAQKASQAVQYWRQTTQDIRSSPEGEAFPVLATWSKMAAAQANLFADHKLYAEAQETYQLAQQIFPGCPEATYGLAQLLATRGETAQAKELVQDFQSNHSVRQPTPDQFPIIGSPR